MLGIKVKIMLPHDPKGVTGPRNPLPDQIHILDPHEEQIPKEPYSEHRDVQQQQQSLAPAPIAPSAY